MNAIFNYFSSPLKQPAERPPPSSMPLTASRKSFSPREQRLARRTSEGRSPRSRLSNITAVTSDHDNTADVSIVSSHRRQTSITMPPPSTTKRQSTSRQSTSRQSTSARSSPMRKRQSVASTTRVASSPLVRSSPRRQSSVELGSELVLVAKSPTVTPGSVAKKPRRQISRRSSGASAINAKTNGTPRKEKTPEEMQVEEEPEVEQNGEKQPEGDDEQLYEFQRILDYRWVGDKIELEVEWKDGDKTWTEEEIFHADNKTALLEFWRTFKGGRPKNPEQGDIYHVFAIRKHRVRKGEPEVLVEWVGYDNSERTWESQSYIEEVAKAHVDAYFNKVSGQTKAPRNAKVNGKAKPKATPKAPAKTSTNTRTRTRGASRVTKR